MGTPYNSLGRLLRFVVGKFVINGFAVECSADDFLLRDRDVAGGFVDGEPFVVTRVSEDGEPGGGTVEAKGLVRKLVEAGSSEERRSRVRAMIPTFFDDFSGMIDVRAVKRNLERFQSRSDRSIAPRVT